MSDAIRPYEEAFRLLCGGSEPPTTVNPRLLTDDEHFELQTWCFNHSTLVWSTGIGIIDAAHILVSEAWSNGNFAHIDVDEDSLKEPQTSEERVQELEEEVEALKKLIDNQNQEEK